jgi:glycosyltransferase involved in cell wall biosynthesis
MAAIKEMSMSLVGEKSPAEVMTASPRQAKGLRQCQFDRVSGSERKGNFITHMDSLRDFARPETAAEQAWSNSGDSKAVLEKPRSWGERQGKSLPPIVPPKMRVALVHDWLETFGGSERVLEQLLLCFPSADVFAVVDFLSEEDRKFLKGTKVHTSFIQRLPAARRIFRHYLGLMPIAVQQFDLSAYDLIISSSHAVAKGVLTGPDQLHISYVHTPMRYIWDLQHQYLNYAKLTRGLKAIYIRWLFGRLREWDVSSSHQVDHFLANSSYIARRIRKAYGRHADVIHPPVDLDRFVLGTERDDYYLLATRFVPYKCAEMVVESFRNQPGRRLVVVGDGPENARVRAAAGNATNITFLGMVPGPKLVDLMQRARAAVFAAEEDFGITMVEAQACGTPVIAFRRGGAADIIRSGETDSPTGVLFDHQEPHSLHAAVDAFESIETMITREMCRANADRFSQGRFRDEIYGFVNSVAGPAGLIAQRAEA